MMKKMLCNYGLILICSLLAFALLFAVNISYDLQAEEEIVEVAESNSEHSLFGKIKDASYIKFFTNIKEYASNFGEIADSATDVVVELAGTNHNSDDAKEIAFKFGLARIACYMSFIFGIFVMIMGGFSILSVAVIMIYTLCAPKKAVEEEKKEGLAGYVIKFLFSGMILAYISMWLPIIFGNMALNCIQDGQEKMNFTLSFAGGINYLIVIIAVVVVYVVGKLIIHSVCSDDRK